MSGMGMILQGQRTVLRPHDAAYPDALRRVGKPPQELFVIGDVAALDEGLSIVGARKATPYGRSCATRFARLAAERGITVISGGARGCDTFSHEAALAVGGRTVAFLGGGCDQLYPPENRGLFQRIVDGGGAVVSEQSWDTMPRPWMFRERNRLIAGLAKATLIVEAGLPSGTFSTADEALAADRDVLVVPGAITSSQSRGANRLIYQGATPIVDDETFQDQLFSLFGCLNQEDMRSVGERIGVDSDSDRPEDIILLRAIQAKAMSLDEMLETLRAEGHAMGMPELMMWIATHAKQGDISQYPDGRYGPTLKI